MFYKQITIYSQSLMFTLHFAVDGTLGFPADLRINDDFMCSSAIPRMLLELIKLRQLTSSVAYSCWKQCEISTFRHRPITDYSHILPKIAIHKETSMKLVGSEMPRANENSGNNVFSARNKWLKTWILFVFILIELTFVVDVRLNATTELNWWIFAIFHASQKNTHCPDVFSTTETSGVN